MLSYFLVGGGEAETEENRKSTQRRQDTGAGDDIWM